VGKLAICMRKIFILLSFCVLFSCHKEPMQNTCIEDGEGSFHVRNSMNVKLDVSIFPNNGGPWLTTNGTLFLKTLDPGESWSLPVSVGEYRIAAHGEEPGPFAHNVYDFSEIETADDCETVKIEY